MKRKLLFAIAALLCTVGAWAQIDVTSKYLTNPSFETGDLTGWSVLNEGNVVDPSGDTGVKAVSSYSLTNADGDYIFNYYQEAWRWNEALDGIQQVVTGLPAGTYRLTAVLGGWNGWTMTLHANSSTQEKAMSANDEGVEFSVDVTINPGENLTIKATMVTKTTNAWDYSFLKADNFKLYRLPEDVTSTITNANLVSDYYTTNNDTWWPVYTTGRTGNKNHPKNWYLHTNGTKNHNINTTTGYFECWKESNGVKRWTLFQDITLPAGEYSLTGQYSTNENRGIIKTVAITPHHTYFSPGITTSNWESWGSETANFTIYEETKVRVGMIATNFAQNHGFTLNTVTAHQFLADEIEAAPSALTSAIATAQAVFDNGSAGDAAYRTAAKDLHDAVVAYKQSLATSENPLDMTDKIANPSFEGVGGATNYVNANHACDAEWTYCSSTDKGAYSATNNNHLITNNTEDGFYYMNLWGSVSDFYAKQTLTSMPAGRYKLTALYASDSGKSATLYMNSTSDGSTVSATGSSTFVKGETIYDLQEAGNVEIGISSNAWFKVDGFQLQYIGTLLTAAQEDWQAAYDAAVEARDDASYVNVTGSEKTALNTAISTYGSKPGTISDCETATEALSTATSTFTSAKASYDAYYAEKSIALEKVGVPAGDITDPTTAAACADAVKALKAQEANYVTATYTVDASNTFGSWTPNNVNTASGEHWSGDGRSYDNQWSGSGYTMSVTQTVTLPAGRYAFKAAARAQENGINHAYNLNVMIGETTTVVDFTAQGNSARGIETDGTANYSDGGTYANNGNGWGWEWREIAFELDTETEVRLQVYAQIYGGNWVSFSDYQLLTTTDNKEICRRMYVAAKTAAETARDDAAYTIVTGKERTDLVAAINAEVTDTYSWYQTQEATLLDATATFTAAKDTYDEYAQESVVATTLDVGVPAITSSTTASTLISNMQTMNVSEYTAATTNYTFNATALLSGAWSNAPGNNHGESWDGNDSDEYYDLYNSAARAMSKTVTLPKASYVLIAKGRASTDGRLTLSDGTNTVTFPHKGNSGKGITTTGAASFSDGTFANENNGRGWEYRFLTFESDGSTPKTLTFNWTTASSNWAGLDDITLLAIPETVELDEDDEYTPVYTIGNVTLSRSIAANTWSTFVVPFDIDNTTLEDQFGDDVRVSEFSADDKTGVTFTPIAEPAITANKPVLLRVTSAKSSFTFNGVTIEEGEPTFSQAGVNFVGNYGGEITIPNTLDTYFVKSNALKKSTGKQKLLGFRAYFTVDADSGVKAFFENGFNFDDADGIKAIDNGQLTIDNAEIFNLAGQKMSKLQKGVNIVNGKKVLVK